MNGVDVWPNDDGERWNVGERPRSYYTTHDTFWDALITALEHQQLMFRMGRYGTVHVDHGDRFDCCDNPDISRFVYEPGDAFLVCDSCDAVFDTEI